MASNALSTGSRKTSRRPLILASVFGALSALLVLTYLQSAKTTEKPTTLATVPAVFALRDIPERTQIKEGMVEIRQIPVDARHRLAVSETGAVVGKITRVPISAGEQILSAKIAGEVKDVGFSAVVPDGKRAVAIGVTEVIATGGQISPGDYVDVIGVFEVNNGSFGGGNETSPFGGAPAAGPKVFSAVTVLQHVQVLAVAQKTDPNLPATNAKPSNNQPEAKSVTLAVSPEDAERLFLAEKVGNIRLSLRPFGDEEKRKIQPVFNELDAIVGS